MFATKHLLQLSVHQCEVLPPEKFEPSSGSRLVSFVQYGAVSFFTGSLVGFFLSS